jgi:hypothetical protein
MERQCAHTEDDETCPLGAEELSFGIYWTKEGDIIDNKQAFYTTCL